MFLGEDYKPPNDASSDDSCSSGVEEIESGDNEDTDEERPKVVLERAFILVVSG